MTGNNKRKGLLMVKIFQGLIKAFFSAFMQAFLNLLVGKLNQTVLQIVNAVGSNDDWSDEAKRKEAFAQIKLIAANAGIELKDSVLNLAIEIAVKIWKGERTI